MVLGKFADLRLLAFIGRFWSFFVAALWAGEVLDCASENVRLHFSPILCRVGMMFLIANRVQSFHRAQAVGGQVADPGVDLVLDSGHSNHEEFVQV